MVIVFLYKFRCIFKDKRLRHQDTRQTESYLLQNVQYKKPIQNYSMTETFIWFKLQYYITFIFVLMRSTIVFIYACITQMLISIIVHY